MKKQYIKNNQDKGCSTRLAVMLLIFTILVSIPGTTIAATNLILNGDLEISDLSNANLPLGWFTGHQFVEATTTYSYPVAGMTGNGAQVTIENDTSGIDAKWYFAKVPVVGGKEYQFTNNYSATHPTEIVVEFFDVNSQHLSYEGFFPIAATLPNTWSSANVLFTAPANAFFATVFHSIQNGSLTVDDYVMNEITPAAPVVFDKGIVSFTFDDGWYSQFSNAVPVLNEKNIDGSFYVISGAMNSSGDGYATSSTLLAAQAAGHEIGAHTVNHCNLATGLCPDGNPANTPDLLTALEEIANSRTEILSAGITPVETFVYPYGAFLTPETTDIVAASGFIGARTTQEGYNNKSSDTYTLKTYIVDRSVTEGDFNRVKNWVDTAIQNREWLILSFHQVENADIIASKNLSGATTPDFFDQILNYVAQKRDTDQVVVKTLREVLAHCMDDDESDCVNNLPPSDTTPPVITIDPYITTATNQDIVVTAHVDEGVLNATSTTFSANGTFTFIATDIAGNSTSTLVTITNIDKDAPVITLVGSNPQGISLGYQYVEQGVNAFDVVDGDITSSVSINTTNVNVNAAGAYIVTYEVTDSAGNVAVPMNRTVQVARRSINVVANPISKVFATSDPVLTYTLASSTLLIGDSFSGALVRVPGEAVGIYDISIGSLAAGQNYAINFTGSTLAITPPVCEKGYVLKNNQCVKKSGGGGTSKRRTTVTPVPTATVLGVSSTTVAAAKFIFVSTLQIGSRGTEVTELQKRLTAEGVYTGPVTGYFGTLTQAAVKRYQALKGIEQVGIVGPKTRAALNK